MRQNVEVWIDVVVKQVEGRFVGDIKIVEGMMVMVEVYVKMSQVFGGFQGLLQYMMIEKGIYVELVKVNVEVVWGMVFKISIWNIGVEVGGEGGVVNGMVVMCNIYQMLLFFMMIINEQIGIILLEWQFGKMVVQIGEVQKVMKFNSIV